MFTPNLMLITMTFISCFIDFDLDLQDHRMYEAYALEL